MSSDIRASREPLTPGRRVALGSSGAITRQQIARYAGASGDFLPIHVDEAYAVSRGHPAVMVHGMWTMGWAGRQLSTWIEPERITRFGGRFTTTVWPGDEITVEAVVGEIDPESEPKQVMLAVMVRNQTGVVVFAGYASVLAEA